MDLNDEQVSNAENLALNPYGWSLYWTVYKEGIIESSASFGEIELTISLQLPTLYSDPSLIM